ncbi:MAG TPA: hypothetical protein VFA50_04400 [Stellaceae bacterium]|nr:hypothetical protein [Stellaceae bacterium]
MTRIWHAALMGALLALAPVSAFATGRIPCAGGERESALPCRGAADLRVLRVAATAPAEAAMLEARGNEALANGDLAAARLLYARAAELGSVTAATAMGTTFDPVYFRKWRVEGLRPEPDKAEAWYRKALAAGDAAAGGKLRELIASGALPQPRSSLTTWVTAPAKAATPGQPASRVVNPLTRESIEAILAETGVQYRIIPPEEFKIEYPGISYAWVTSDEVFGAVVQLDTSGLPVADAAPTFVTRVNSGCAGAASVALDDLETLKGGVQTRRAISDCTTDTARLKVSYTFVQNGPAMTVFMAVSADAEAAQHHSDALLATVRKMVIAGE